MTHSRGALLEESHYYPGGLVQSGISYKASGKLENKKSKFNGYELNSDFDLNLYESFYRMHDPQLGGRFWQIDPKPDFEISPYAAMRNNPVLNMDPLGDTLVPILKGIGGGMWNVAKNIVTAFMPVEKPEPGTVDVAAAFGIITKDQAMQEIAAMNSKGQQGIAEAITETALSIGLTAAAMKGGGKTPEGIVYERIDKAGVISKPYVGQAKNASRYAARQKEHARANPNSDFEFKIIDRGNPGKNLNLKEQKALDTRGGPTNKSNPNGGTSNKKNVIKKEKEN